MGGDGIVYIDGPTSRRPVTNPIFNVFSLACRRSFILSNIERVAIFRDVDRETREKEDFREFLSTHSSFHSLSDRFCQYIVVSNHLSRKPFDVSICTDRIFFL